MVVFGALIVAIALCAIFAVYVLPGMLKPRLEEKLGAATSSEVHIGLIKVYPFKFALALYDFSAKNKAANLTGILCI